MTPLTERNQKNSQKSTGPRTDSGKARSSQNSLKNGLYAISAKLPSEDQELYLAHSAAYVADLHPEGAAQQALVEIVSDNTWRLRRVRVLLEAQTDFLIRSVDCPVEISVEAFIKEQAAATRALESLSRHEQRMQNGMVKALKQLKELQKEAAQQNAQSEAAESESGSFQHPKIRPPPQAPTEPNPRPKSPPKPRKHPLAASKSSRRRLRNGKIALFQPPTRQARPSGAPENRLKGRPNLVQAPGK
jgi:hypothetical protein